MFIEAGDRHWFLLVSADIPVVQYVVNAKTADRVKRYLGILKGLYSIDEIAVDDVVDILNDAVRIQSIDIRDTSMDILIKVTNQFYVLRTIF